MKKKVKKAFSLLLAACMTIGGTLPCGGTTEVKAAANLTDGLVGYWDFENGELTNKVSGSTCTAEKVGTGVELQADEGVSNGSAYFSKEANSYLRLNMNQSFNAQESDFTIAAWVKYDTDAFSNTSENMNLFQQSDGAANPNGRTILFLKTDRKYGTFLRGANCVWEQTVDLGTWNHVAFTSNHTTNKAQLYLNGNLAAEKDMEGSAGFYNGFTDILVGAHKNPEAKSAIKGSVDELRVYNKIVSADVVKAMYDEFADDTQTDTLKSGLIALIEQAKNLDGGTDEAEEQLQIKIAEAEALVNENSLTANALTEMTQQLQTVMDDYRANIVIGIAVDTEDELRNIPSAMFGINHRYHKYGYGSWDTTTNAIAEDFNKLTKEAGFGSVRYPGGTVSNLFTWKDTIGPKEERTTVIAGNNFYSAAGETPVDPAFGVDEAMKWIYDDLGAEAIFVYGLGRGNPSDAADLVEYLNAPNDGSNPNGGVDWAQKRAENGHPEPYGVVRFEIGNEYSDTGQDYWMAGKGDMNAVDAYINGGLMTFSGQTSYYQQTNNVGKKGDWRASASLSDGKPNEERYVYYSPVAENSVTVSVAGTAWTIVDSLEGKGAQNVCTFDYETGKITFGDGTNGNIPAAGAKITADYQSPQAGFVDYYDAMKEVADQIGMDIEIYSGIVDRLQKDFISKMHQAGFDDKYDGVIIHPYSSGYGNADSYEASLAKAKAQAAYVGSHKTAMEQTTGDDSKKVAVSEFGILSPASDYQTSLGHALFIANQMIDCVNAGAAYQNKHCLVDFTVGDNLGAWQQCVIQCHNLANGSYEYVSTPSARLFSIFNNMTGNVQVNQMITGNGDYYTDSNGTVKNINVYSTKDDEGNTYVLVINNKKSDNTAVNISVDGRDLTDKEIEVWYLTSANVDDMNTLNEPDKVAVQKKKVTAEADIAYTLAPHSVTSFRIPAETIPETAAITTKAGEGGSVSESVEAEVGSEVTVTATANEGYEFVGWFKGEEKVSENTVYTFTVAETVELTAKFTKKQVPEPNPDNEKQPEIIVGGVTPEGADAVKTEIAVPAKLKAKKTSKGIRLSWKKVKGANGYMIYRSYKKSKGYKKIATLKKGGKKVYLDRKAKKGKTCYYKIKAYRKVGGKKVQSAYSKIVRKKR